MATKNLVLTYLVVIFMLLSCNSTQQINPAEAGATVSKIWHKEQHTVWEVDWSAAPIGGRLTVENWRFGKNYRFEILESTASSLVGETLVFNGEKSWSYNRFVDKTPLVISPARLSPVTDAFTIIDRLIATSPPKTASRRVVWFNRQQTALEITLTFSNSDRLVVWYDEETELPIKLIFSVSDGGSATLKARSFEPLSEPLLGLFEVVE